MPGLVAILHGHNFTYAKGISLWVDFDAVYALIYVPELAWGLILYKC